MRGKGATNQLPFPAGDAKIPGGLFTGHSLPDRLRHGANEVYSISPVTDEVIQFTGELE